MNANELTKKLITTLAVLPAIIEDWGICATPYEQKKHNLSGDIAMAKSAVDEAATMLRQQQAEIESLKAENKFFKDLMGDVEILRGEK